MSNSSISENCRVFFVWKNRVVTGKWVMARAPTSEEQKTYHLKRGERVYAVALDDAGARKGEVLVSERSLFPSYAEALTAQRRTPALLFDPFAHETFPRRTKNYPAPRHQGHHVRPRR